MDYLAQLNEAYDGWIERAPEENIVVKTIDIENRDFEQNEDDFRIIYQPILEMEKQSCIDDV